MENPFLVLFKNYYQLISYPSTPEKFHVSTPFYLDRIIPQGGYLQ
jgi:hypothetical protein